MLDPGNLCGSTRTSRLLDQGFSNRCVAFKKR
jgi:hypothetical protein